MFASPTSSSLPNPVSEVSGDGEIPASPSQFWLKWDLQALKFLYGLRIPPWLNLPLIFFVRIGDGWLWAGIAAWLWVALPWVFFKHTVEQCLLAVGISLLFYWPLKLITKRARPYNALHWVTGKVPPLDKYSFPSGHTMNNLAVSLTLASLIPSLYVPAIGIPVVLGVLRVVFGVHFLSDIVAGVVLGTLSHLGAKGLLLYMAF